MRIDLVKRWLSRILIALTVSAVYLYGYPSATISYAVADLFHIDACSRANHSSPVWAGFRSLRERFSECC